MLTFSQSAAATRSPTFELEMGVREVTAAATQPCEIEAKHANPASTNAREI